MKTKDKCLKISIIVCLVLVEITSVFLMYKSSTDNVTKLEDVRLRERTNKNNVFAIMMEQSDGTYFASDSNAWPTDMKFNSDKSGCIDRNGNKIENALTYDSTNNLVTVSTQGTSYCYLYFDLDKTGPIITNALDAGDGKITFTVTDELNEVSKYCVNSNSTDTSNCTWYDAVEGTQTTGSIVTDSGDYYVHVSDTLGNIGHSSKVTMEVSNLAGEKILSAAPSGLSTTLEGGLYRYQGTNDIVNNYVCFGYSDAGNNCDFTNTTNSDKYAYRIIGINELGQLKLIKKEAINTAYLWNSSTGVTWPNSSLYTNLNGSYFYGNTTYISESWKSKIAITSWKYGDITTYNTTADSVYTTENSWGNTVSAKIGLMYMHDYYYAYQSGGLNCAYDASYYSDCRKAWIYLSNCDSNAPEYGEWLMSRYTNTISWFINIMGGVGNWDMSDSLFSIRPVFYLTSDVQYVSGTGASTDPFIVK